MATGPFNWIAIYRDGSSLWQYQDQDGRERSTEEIDRAQLATLALVDADYVPCYIQHFQPGQRMIYRRRTAMTAGGATTVKHLIGWQETIAGRNVQHLAAVCDASGRVECVQRYDERHPWFRPIEEVAADAVETKLNP